MATYPGSIVERGEFTGKQFLDNIFNATNGLFMSQLNEITGVITPTLQNWTARGFISRAVNKRYSKDQTARILIINLLRRTMSLDGIKKLLIYVNGNLEEKNDDIISESQLYYYICDVVFDSEFSYKNIDALLNKALNGYVERFKGAYERLKIALKTICINYLAGNLIAESDKTLSNIQEQNIFGVKI